MQITSFDTATVSSTVAALFKDPRFITGFTLKIIDAVDNVSWGVKCGSIIDTKCVLYPRNVKLYPGRSTALSFRSCYGGSTVKSFETDSLDVSELLTWLSGTLVDAILAIQPIDRERQSEDKVFHLKI